MRKYLFFVLTVLAVLGAGTAVRAAPPPVPPGSYFIYDTWGGTWQDANKTTANTEDDLMCWAAAASNVLAWGQWGTPAYDTSATIFTHFQDHWTDNAGWPNYAWRWWFDGTAPSYSSYSYVDVPGGGEFYPQVNFLDYYMVITGKDLMTAVDKALHSGYGVVLDIYKGFTAHAVTLWGFDYEVVNKKKVYTNIYITDSDDNSTGLMKYALTLGSSGYTLGGSYSGWIISDALGLKLNSSLIEPLGSAPVPLPGSVFLLASGLLGLGWWRRRR